MALLPDGSELVAEEIGWFGKGLGNGMAWWLHGYLTWPFLSNFNWNFTNRKLKILFPGKIQ